MPDQSDPIATQIYDATGELPAQYTESSGRYITAYQWFKKWFKANGVSPVVFREWSGYPDLLTAMNAGVDPDTLAGEFGRKLDEMRQRETALAIANPEIAQWQLMEKQAVVYLASRLLPEAVGSLEAALTIMAYGRAIGVEPLVALNQINIIKGKPTVSPQLMLALARKTGELADLQISDDGDTCTVTLTRKGQSPHTEKFSMTDAKAMNLDTKDNWKKQAAVMRKWRAIAAACRIVFPDIIAGFYTPEEMGTDAPIED